MTRPSRSESRALGALTELLRTAVRPPSVLELDRGLSELRARVLSARASSRRGRRQAVLACALGVCVVLSVLGVGRLLQRARVRHPPVAVARVDGGRILEGGYLSELGHGGVRIYFNEGSRFVLTPGTRGRLGAVTREGARLVLDHGTASFLITPNPDGRWRVEAGPFSVSVRGTDFSVVWDPTRERLEVELRRGRVAVSGPVLGDELILRPGQRLSVSIPQAETVITDARTGRTPEPAPSEDAPTPSALLAPGVPSSSPPMASPAPSSTAAAGGNGRRWREAMAHGEWDRILEDVERDGVETSLRTLSGDELFVLADAARYRRRPELARAALLAVRQRFPARSSQAAFFLGRVEELHAGGKAAAIRWYDEYLARAPTGTYAAEALGRKMILVEAVEGRADARALAREYLRRFPGGSYAAAARALELAAP